MLRRMLYSQLVGTVLYGVDGIRVGQVRRVLVDEITGRPEWVAVSTGALGARQRLVPVMAADLQLDGIRVPYPAAAVAGAPRFDPRDAAPDQAAEEELYRHYAMDAEPPPLTRRPSTDQVDDTRHKTDHNDDGDDGAGDDAAVPTVGASPVPVLGGWDVEKVRQLLEQAFSYPQQPRGTTGEASTIEFAAPIADADAEQDPRMPGEGQADRGR